MGTFELVAALVHAIPALSRRRPDLHHLYERQFLIDALARQGGNVTRAAADIGLYRQQLQAKRAEYGIDPEQYR